MTQASVLCREPFPLLMDPGSYYPDTLGTWSSLPKIVYWLGHLEEQVDNTCFEKLWLFLHG